MLRWVEHEKSFITSRPVLSAQTIACIWQQAFLNQLKEKLNTYVCFLGQIWYAVCGHGIKWNPATILAWISIWSSNSYLTVNIQQNFNGSNKLGIMKIVLANGSSSHPGWIMHEMTWRDYNGSSSWPRWMSHQSSSHWSSTVEHVPICIHTLIHVGHSSMYII